MQLTCTRCERTFETHAHGAREARDQGRLHGWWTESGTVPCPGCAAAAGKAPAAGPDEAP